MKEQYDVLVIGGGPGGYVAAIRAAQLGLKTALVEDSALGGTCLNWGCIPTKSLLKGADMVRALKHMSTFGLSADNVQFDLSTLVQHSRDSAAKLSGGIEYLLKKNNVLVVRGYATVVAKGEVRVKSDSDESTFFSKHIILATGARPKVIPDINPDGLNIWSYVDAMTPSKLPASLLVVGSGAIGMEFASFYCDLGVDVTLVEVQDRIMPLEDRAVSVYMEKEYRQRGINVLTNTQLDTTANTSGGIQAKLRHSSGSEQTVEVEKILVSVGIEANTGNMGLEQLGVDLQRGFIAVDQWCRTNVAGLYAIGDVAGGPCLAHKASHEAVMCVEKIAGIDDVRAINKSAIASCTFSYPQVASIGLTEQQAKEKGIPIKLGVFDQSSNGKAIAIDEPKGFVKTVFDQTTGELLGAHMVGYEVAEQIQGFAIAMALEATEQEIAHSIFPHPTQSESMYESVLDACDKAIHH
jgi:dihydrolipoyl dehydrogenase